MYLSSSWLHTRASDALTAAGRSNSSPRGRICQTLECSKRPQNNRRKKLKSISQLAVQNLFVSINNFLTISEVRCRHFFYEILMSCHLDARKSWVRSEQVLRLLTKVFHSVSVTSFTTPWQNSTFCPLIEFVSKCNFFKSKYGFFKLRFQRKNSNW